MANKFADGTVVQLKSGGPLMVVNTRNQFGEYYCQWFNGPDVKSGTFKEEVLREREEP